MNLLALLFLGKTSLPQKGSSSLPKPRVDFDTILERMQHSSTKPYYHLPTHGFVPQKEQALLEPKAFEKPHESNFHTKALIDTESGRQKPLQVLVKPQSTQNSRIDLAKAFVFSTATPKSNPKAEGNSLAKNIKNEIESHLYKLPKPLAKTSNVLNSEVKSYFMEPQKSKASQKDLAKIVPKHGHPKNDKKVMVQEESASIDKKVATKKPKESKRLAIHRPPLHQDAFPPHMASHVGKSVYQKVAKKERTKAISSPPTKSRDMSQKAHTRTSKAKQHHSLSEPFFATKTHDSHLKAKYESMTKSFEKAEASHIQKSKIETMASMKKLSNNLPKKSKKDPIKEEPKISQKNLVKGVVPELATHTPAVQGDPSIQESFPSYTQHKIARQTPSISHPQRQHLRKMLTKDEPSVTKPHKKIEKELHSTIPETIHLHSAKEPSIKEGFVHHVAHHTSSHLPKEPKKEGNLRIDDHLAKEESAWLVQKAEPMTKELKQHRVESPTPQNSFEDISSKTQHAATTQDSPDQSSQSFDQHQDLGHTEHANPQEPEPQMPEFQKRILTIRLDQTHININLNANQLSLTFFSPTTFHNDGSLGEFIDEVMQQSGFDKYKVTLKDRQKRVEILSKESKTSSSPRSVIDVKV